VSYEALKFGDAGWNMPAWLDFGDGKAPQECVIRELSDTSARLLFARAQTAPDRFVLRMNKSGSLRRDCRVAARDSTELDVTFA
jgi:hypothetical protein